MLRKRLFATFYNLTGHPSEEDKFTRQKRIPLVGQASGDVLEIGAGTGGNLAFYPPDVSLTLLEPNPFMIRYLRRTLDERGLSDAAVIEAQAEGIPLPDASMDTVVSVHVLCSVRDQAHVLAEIKRVLRPGGRFLFLEHVADHPGTVNHTVQRVINPAWRFVGDGCHLTRDTGAAIRAAGFSKVVVDDFRAAWGGVVGPHVTGYAVV